MSQFLRRGWGALRSTASRGIEEFIDATHSVKDASYGRAWRASELRLKDTGDLQKLWFVLLKERNVLYTLRYDCSRRHAPMPHPERLAKVRQSMSVLQTVLRERFLEKRSSSQPIPPSPGVAAKSASPSVAPLSGRPFE